MTSKSRRVPILVIIVVAVGSIGSYLLTTRTVMSSPVATFMLYGKLFFDYNGNGNQDRGEPGVPDAVIALDGKNATSTSSAGWYMVADLTRGNHTIRSFPPRNFRYVCESVAEHRPVEEPHEISVIDDTRKDIGLMEGFLTLPFSSSTPVEIADHFDHDPGLDRMWWNGRTLTGSGGHSPPHTHPGIDLVMPIGTVLVAAVSGRVAGINTTPGSVYWIAVSIRDGYGMTYLHIDKPLVSTGTTVKRGEPIALSGDTGSPGSPHLEFQLWRLMPDSKHYCIDPYSPVAGVPKGAWIAGAWEWFPSDETWVSQGYWTRGNDPQYFDKALAAERGTCRIELDVSPKPGQVNRPLTISGVMYGSWRCIRDGMVVRKPVTITAGWGFSTVLTTDYYGRFSISTNCPSTGGIYSIIATFYEDEDLTETSTTIQYEVVAKIPTTITISYVGNREFGGYLRRADTGAYLANKLVKLTVTYLSGTAWQTATYDLQTRQDGYYSLEFLFYWNTATIVFEGDETYASSSATITR